MHWSLLGWSSYRVYATWWHLTMVAEWQNAKLIRLVVCSGMQFILQQKKCQTIGIFSKFLFHFLAVFSNYCLSSPSFVNKWIQHAALTNHIWREFTFSSHAVFASRWQTVQRQSSIIFFRNYDYSDIPKPSVIVKRMSSLLESLLKQLLLSREATNQKTLENLERDDD